MVETAKGEIEFATCKSMAEIVPQNCYSGKRHENREQNHHIALATNRGNSVHCAGIIRKIGRKVKVFLTDCSDCADSEDNFGKRDYVTERYKQQKSGNGN